MIFPVVFPILILLFFINRYAINIPYSDHWSMVPIFQKIGQHENALGLLWQPWNEHRIFFPRVVMTVTAYITNWNTVAETLLSVCFGLLTLTVLFFFLRRTIKHRWLVAVALSISSFWLFSPVQSENWLWGWNLVWFICVAAAITSIFFVTCINPEDEHRKQYFYLAGGIGTAFIATFSLGGALVIWPVCLSILVLKKVGTKPMLLWVASMLLSVSAYYYKYEPTNTGSNLSISFITTPLKSAGYFLTMLGRPFTDDVGAAILLGTIMTLLLVPIAIFLRERRNNLEKYFLWLGLIGFSLLSILTITVGRIGSDLHSATSSRYTTFPILFIIGLVGLIIVILDGHIPKRKTLVMYAVLTIVLVNMPLLVSSYVIGLNTSQLWRKQMLSIKYCTHMQQVTDECLLKTNYLRDTGLSRAQLQYIRDKHWGGF